ncbi:uncharacterized protein LOC143200196 [Rhynchophorus ferrugineus]|uniref:uncharacterized protein LOC143200196 n=1 Tax=Rhynchophorus ferrugineus TaxID=354439 RepID=UPI003FCC8DDF
MHFQTADVCETPRYSHRISARFVKIVKKVFWNTQRNSALRVWSVFLFCANYGCVVYSGKLALLSPQKASGLHLLLKANRDSLEFMKQLFEKEITCKYHRVEEDEPWQIP